MNVIALVGTSGTGKSYRAIHLASEKKLDYIIDDGLFIKGNKIIAGKSAKRQATTITAVKTALFMDESHKQEVKKVISEVKPSGILIIGTSKRMVDKIAFQLQIGAIREYVYIEEISTEEERKIARKQRMQYGKHVIPVPTFEIKKDFSGYFIDPLKILRKRKDDTIQISEKSIVRPTFSYMGNYTISDKVISDLSIYAMKCVEGVKEVLCVDVYNYTHGVVIYIDISIVYGENIKKISRQVQEAVKREIECMTALNILAINLYIKKIVTI